MTAGRSTTIFYPESDGMPLTESSRPFRRVVSPLECTPPRQRQEEREAVRGRLAAMEGNKRTCYGRLASRRTTCWRYSAQDARIWRYDQTGGDFYREPLVGERLVDGEYRARGAFVGARSSKRSWAPPARRSSPNALSRQAQKVTPLFAFALEGAA